MKQNISTIKEFLSNTKITNQLSKYKIYNFTQPIIKPSPNRPVVLEELMITTKA
jgi:hypothetical protein